jgi:hypothetical protein
MVHADKGTFETIFKDCGMWFNHITKIEDKEMISINHLWKIVLRGAMILCATIQEGIDIILPVCDVKQNLGPDSVTAIIIQVKNAKDYDATIESGLFDVMNVVVKSIFYKDDSNETRAQKKRKLEKQLNTIRITGIFAGYPDRIALASPEPAVNFRASGPGPRNSPILTGSLPSISGLRASQTKRSGRFKVKIRLTLQKCFVVNDSLQNTSGVFTPDDPCI